MRSGVHDTAGHMATLRRAVAQHPEHRLASAVVPLATRIAHAYDALDALPPLPPVNGHGDLKLNNIVFAESTATQPLRAEALIDLDTVGPLHIAHELGDMWRSWCNRSGEDSTEAQFDLAVFEASWRGYRAGCQAPMDRATQHALAIGVEIISLELAARFAADALRESYFGYDSARYASAGEHNLVRARGQWALHRAAAATRAERKAILAS